MHYCRSGDVSAGSSCARDSSSSSNNSRQRERERERCSFFGSSRPAALSLWGGALEDGPLRLLAVPSSLGGWTLLQAGGGLSLIPAATLLQRPLKGPLLLRAITVKVKFENLRRPCGGPGYSKHLFLSTLAREGTLNFFHRLLSFAIAPTAHYLAVGRGRPSATRS